MKKAFVDQIMLGLFLFVALIVLGATIADNKEARNKFYKLKKVSDNAAIAMAKYYTTVEANTDNAENIANELLKQTKLGLEIIDNIEYDWDFSTTPATLTTSVENYKHETFWFKFLDVNSFDISVKSVVEIQPETDIESTSNLLPFGINGCDESHLTPGANLLFDLRGERGYSNSDYTEFYGIGLDNECTASGNSKWAHFKNNVHKEFYVEDNFLQTDEEKYNVDTQSPICIPSVSSLGMEQDNDPKQISQAFKNLEDDADLVGVQTDLVMLDCGSTASNLIIKKFITVEFLTSPYSTYDRIRNDYSQFQFHVKVIGSTEPTKVILKE